MIPTLKSFLLIGAVLLAPLEAAQPQQREGDIVRVGIQETLSPEVYVDSFAPTMLHLRTSFPAKRFVSANYSVQGLIEAVRTGAVDVFFADSGVFLYSLRHQTTQIAARLTPGGLNPRAATAMAMVARVSDAPEQLKEAAKLRIACDDPHNTGTWMAFQSHMLERGFSLREVLELEKQAVFTRYEFPDPLTLVMIGEADLAIVPACTLEDAVRQGAVAQGALRVLDPQTPSALGCAHTSDVFPGVIMGASTALDASTLKDILLAVQLMPSREGADAWGIVNDFSSVDSVYQRLQTGPYAYLRETDWRMLWERYQEWIWSLAALVLFGIFHVLRSRRLVELRTRELRMAERRLTNVRERMFVMERAGIISGLCSMLVHEVKQPLAALAAYAGGLKMALRGRAEKNDPVVTEACEAILTQAARIDDIVEHVRTYARSGRPQELQVDLLEVMKRAAASLTASSVGRDVRIAWSLPEHAVLIKGEPLELELAVLNLMKNGLRASRQADDDRLELSLKVRQNKAEVSVRDFGRPLDEQAFARLSRPGRPEKGARSDGLGIGLMLVRRIVESHGGSLVFRRADDGGTVAALEFALAQADNEHEREDGKRDRKDHA